MELHDRLDRAVAAAYGWPGDLDDAAMVARLVALNMARRAEERRGHVRWLRPDWQRAAAGPRSRPSIWCRRTWSLPARHDTIAQARLPARRDRPDRTLVLAALRMAGELDAATIARGFAQGRRIERRIRATLEALVRLGHVSVERSGYRLRRIA